jgi:hypothetical protein
MMHTNHLAQLELYTDSWDVQVKANTLQFHESVPRLIRNIHSIRGMLELLYNRSYS